MELTEITPKLEKLADELVAWRDEASKELKSYGETSKSTAAGVASLEQKLGDLHVKVEKMSIPAGDTTPSARKSIGTQFTESKEFKDMLASGETKSSNFEIKALTASSIVEPVVGYPVQDFRIPGAFLAPRDELRVTDIVSRGNTASNAVSFVQGTYTKAAAPVKEGNRTTVTAKPEAKIDFNQVIVPVQTIAVTIPITRQVLDDAPALRTIIDNQLSYDVADKREQQILFGTGVTPELNGIVPQATAFNDALLDTLGVTSPTALDALRIASLQVSKANFPNQAFVLNPQDWAGIELLKDSTGKYIWVSVPDGGVPRLWRIPVIESQKITPGTFLCGNFTRGATLFEREGITIRVSDSDKDNFGKNLITVLCELRCALAVTFPYAFVAGSFPVEEP